MVPEKAKPVKSRTWLATLAAVTAVARLMVEFVRVFK